MKLIGILDYGIGKVYCEEYDKYDAVVFKSFLRDILKRYPAGNIIMVLDNARLHYAKLVQPLFQKNGDRLELVLLAPYSPESILIEGLCGWLKSSVINNAFYPTLSKVRVAVQNFINQINKVPTQIIDRLCIKM